VTFELNITKSPKTKKTYLNQEEHIRNFGRSLNRCHNLKYLQLHLPNSSLANISNLLREILTMNQLVELDLQTFDDTLIGTESIRSICDFLERQRNSLIHLKLSISFTTNAEAMSHICKSVSQLKKLKRLFWHVNYGVDLDNDDYSDFFKKIIDIENLSYQETDTPQYQARYSDIAIMLSELQNLESLTLLNFRPDSFSDQLFKKFMRILQTIPLMKSLRDFDFNFPFALIPGFYDPQIWNAFQNLQNISKLNLSTPNLDVDEYPDDDSDFIYYYRSRFARLISKINQRQASKQYLMF